MSISKKVKWIILLCSVCAYALSLFFSALLIAYGEPLPGGELLLLGWMGILNIPFSWAWSAWSAWLAGLAWWANPAYFFAVFAYIIANRSSIAKRANVIALCLAVIALLLGVTSFLAKGQDFGGSTSTIIGFGIGFYLWMVSFFILLIGCLIPSVPKTPAPPNGDAPVS